MFYYNIKRWLLIIVHISDSFDDSKNQDFNKSMIRNVQTAYANENHAETSVVLIKSSGKYLCLAILFMDILVFNRSSPDLF